MRHENERTLATVFVPDGKLHILENLVTAYLDESKDSNKGKPRNQKLLDAIRNIRGASLKALWTDNPEVFPQSGEEAFWWEVWLPVRGDRTAVLTNFKQLAEGLGLRIARGQIEFPERTVLLLHGSVEQMQRSVLTLNSIAEWLAVDYENQGETARLFAGKNRGCNAGDAFLFHGTQPVHSRHQVALPV